MLRVALPALLLLASLALVAPASADPTLDPYLCTPPLTQGGVCVHPSPDGVCVSYDVTRAGVGGTVCEPGPVEVCLAQECRPEVDPWHCMPGSVDACVREVDGAVCVTVLLGLDGATACADPADGEVSVCTVPYVEALGRCVPTGAECWSPMMWPPSATCTAGDAEVRCGAALWPHHVGAGCRVEPMECPGRLGRTEYGSDGRASCRVEAGVPVDALLPA